MDIWTGHLDGTCLEQCPGHVQDIEIFLGHCPVPALGKSTEGITMKTYFETTDTSKPGSDLQTLNLRGNFSLMQSNRTRGIFPNVQSCLLTHSLLPYTHAGSMSLWHHVIGLE